MDNGQWIMENGKWEIIMKAMTKSQLARAAGVSEQTLRVWLRAPQIRQKLAPLKLKKQQILLPPAAVQIIANHYVIKID